MGLPATPALLLRLIPPARLFYPHSDFSALRSSLQILGSVRSIHRTRRVQQDLAVVEKTASPVPAANNRPALEPLLPPAKRPDRVKYTPGRDQYNLPIVQRWYVKDYKKGKHITQMYIGLGEHTGGQYYGG
ncbi:hypothetical protein RvY_03434 [Ramazzottius varieornatus]|uniref:Uncharacterized protein n=1 Tax=Ramazzottius varieornatus TaxID=947166 RepID=A0A1D1UN24_RAMVA|nr:hypothetical protein RvY_03434 [Ramazzottius varieornatus]